MRNLDYDLLRSTSPPDSRVATPALFPAMSQRIPDTAPPPTFHSSNHTLSYSTPLSPESTTPTSSSASPFRDPLSLTANANASGHNPSRTSSVSSVASVATGSKISPAPTTVKQKHYWNYYHTSVDMEPSSSSTSGQQQNSQGSTKQDDIFNAAVGTNYSNNDDADTAPPAPPAPPPVRYTRTGQVIPEGKVMMVNGGCVGEGDWKRSMFCLAIAGKKILEFANFQIHKQPTVRFNRCLNLFTTSSRIRERFPSCYHRMVFGLEQ